MILSRMTSRLAGLAAVFVVTWAATAVAAPSGPPIRIGGTLALTGPLAVPYTKVDTQAAGSYAAWQMLEAAVTATKSLDDKLMAQWLHKNRCPRSSVGSASTARTTTATI